MSKNQQIIILVLAILISVGLVVGGIMNKQARKSGLPSGKPPVTGTHTPPKPKDPETTAVPPVKYVIPTPMKPQPPNHIYKPKPVVAMTAAVREVAAQMRLLSVSITAAIMRSQMGYEQLEQLDFTPGDAVEGGSPLAVFNSQGAVRFRGLLNKWIDQDTLDEVTTEPGQFIWYSLRRQQTADATIDVLFAVIPKPKETLCAAARPVKAGATLQFQNDNGTVVKDPLNALPLEAFKIPTCVTDGDKQYWLYPLRNRLLRTGSRSWQAVP